jgi:hypothetical protein
MSEKFDVEVINDLCIVVRQRYGKNAVEALVGALSSVCTFKQLETLLARWSENG